LLNILLVVEKKLYIELELLLFTKLILRSQINKVDIKRHFCKQEVICVEKSICIREIIRRYKTNKRESYYKSFKYLLNCKNFVVKVKKKELYANNFNIDSNKLNFAFRIINNIFFAKILFNCLFTFVYKRLI